MDTDKRKRILRDPTGFVLRTWHGGHQIMAKGVKRLSDQTVQFVYDPLSPNPKYYNVNIEQTNLLNDIIKRK
jgi:hypothetical protein